MRIFCYKKDILHIKKSKTFFNYDMLTVKIKQDKKYIKLNFLLSIYQSNVLDNLTIDDNHNLYNSPDERRI